MIDVPAYISILFIALTFAIFAVWLLGISRCKACRLSRR